MPRLKDIKDLAFNAYLRSGYIPTRDAALSLMGRARAVVLCYHRIGERDVLTTTPEDFRRDLDYLKEYFEVVGLWQLCERIRTGTPLRRPLASITFDDGYRDNFTEAVPILKNAGFGATFFVSTGFMSTNRVFAHDIDAPRDFPKMTWDDLRTMQEAGFEIGSHTVNHADMGALEAEGIESELHDSLAALKRELGDRPRAFAFPYGKPRNVTAYAVEAARRAGYYAALAAYGGENTRASSLFPLHRVDAGNGLMPWTAWQARIGGFDPDHLRYKLRGGTAKQ